MRQSAVSAQSVFTANCFKPIYTCNVSHVAMSVSISNYTQIMWVARQSKIIHNV